MVAAHVNEGIMQPVMRKLHLLIWAIVLCLGISACNYPGNGTNGTTQEPTPTQAPPSETPIPLAANVAGEILPLEIYEAEVARFVDQQSRVGIALATIPNYREQVLWGLIDLKLLAQGAMEAGYTIDPASLDTRINSIQDTQDAFETWLNENLYSMDSFRSSLEEELLAAEMVAVIVNTVPESTEQAHVRHILVATREDAEDLRAQITAGEDFGELAKIYSIDASTRPAGGDLGWFPPGFLLWSELDQAVFQLNPGDLSDVVETQLGYHLIEVLERGEHQLDYQTRLYLQEQAVEDWLINQKEVKDIQVFIEP
jgi:parvulin-like peptidyl-prolyl isomerase